VNVGARMSRSIVSIDGGASVREAAQRMCDNRVGSVVVLDGDRLAGILTERDVLLVVARGDLEARVDDVMTRGPETTEPDETLEQATLVMLHGGFRHLPVVDGGTVVGMLSMRDLLGPPDEAAPRGV
jgi:CBS domain-containing protein